jgi:adenosylmethionine-8-amino-7-oxononanoate aminotransferase
MAPVSTSTTTSDESRGETSSVLHRQLSEAPLMPARCKGNYIYPAKGGQVLDACGGAAVVSIGHGNEQVIQELVKQMQTVNYVHSAVWTNSAAEELSTILCESSGMARCMLTSGGSEALESAMKLARQYHVERGDDQRSCFIGRKLSYHGNTLGALALGSNMARKAMHLPMIAIDSFHHVSPCYAYRYKVSQDESYADYVERLGKELEDKIKEIGVDRVAAFVFEPVVGATTGCVPFVPGYIREMRRVCDKYGVLLLSDEIMCGMGRTGKTHAWQWDGQGDEARPDIQAVGKGLTGGYAPAAAVLASFKVVNALSQGSGSFNNGFTYQSWAIGARAGVAVQQIIKEQGLVETCRKRGIYLREVLEKHLSDCPHVGDIRGMGLFWGVEFVQDRETKEPFRSDFPIGFKVTAEMLERGIAIYPGGKGTADGVDGDHILIAPPYTITEEELDLIASELRKSIDVVVDTYRRGGHLTTKTFTV